MQQRKRFSILLLSLLLLMLAPPRAAKAWETLALFYDGHLVDGNLQADGAMQLVSLRPLADALGVELTGWDPAEQSIMVKSPYTTLKVQAGNRRMAQGYGGVWLSYPAVLWEGRLWVPVTEMAKALGYLVTQEPGMLFVSRDRTVKILPLPAPFDKQLTVTAALDSNDWTVFTGRVDPALKILAVHLDDVTVPVTADGSFTARLKLDGGQPHFLYFRGETAADIWFGPTLTVSTPKGIQPVIPPGKGLEIQPTEVRPGKVEISQRATAEGALELTMQLKVPAEDVLVFVHGLYKLFHYRNVPVSSEGIAQTTIALPGPAVYYVDVKVRDKKSEGTYRPAVTYEVIQHDLVARDTLGVVVDLVPTLDKIPEGRFGEYVPISGTTTGSGDGFITVWTSYRTGPGATLHSGNSLAAPQRVQVVNGRFAAKIWLKFGPGEYQIQLTHPTNELEHAQDQRFTVEGTGTASHRYLRPTAGAESDDPDILRLATEITAGKASSMEKIKAVYHWVTNNIVYDYEKYHTGRQRSSDGAVMTLKRRMGVCEDYSDLTVALLRAAGVEARTATGMTPRGLHAWAEARADGRWITMDPTWDARHVVNGKELLPAGTLYFDPAPEIFAKDHTWESYEYGEK